MIVCPAVDQDLTIAEFNEATISDNELTESVKKFTADCFQCGQCTIACPAGVQRDILMIYLKYKALKKLSPLILKIL
jgi:Na+-translocating ferredoxin:NAD+ oxidoreductase RnfC subunit